MMRATRWASPLRRRRRNLYSTRCRRRSHRHRAPRGSSLRRRSTAGAEALLGPLEYVILRSLWGRSPATVGEVLASVNADRTGEDLAYTTVMTVLVRLAEKGLLEREKVGRGFSYAPRYDEQSLITHLGEQEVAGVLDRYGDVALAQFASALEHADPALLRRVLELAGEDDRD